MKQKQSGHQGDVQFAEITSLPEAAKKIDKQPLAYGEHSGHIHVATGDYELFEDENFRYIKTGNDGAILQHIFEQNFGDKYEYNKAIEKADHEPIELKPNTVLKIGIHKQYDPFEKIWRQVLD